MSNRSTIAQNSIYKVLTRKSGSMRVIEPQMLLRHDLGFDSMDIAEIIILMESELKCELDALSVFPLRSVEDLSNLKERA